MSDCSSPHVRSAIVEDESRRKKSLQRHSFPKDNISEVSCSHSSRRRSKAGASSLDSPSLATDGRTSLAEISKRDNASATKQQRRIKAIDAVKSYNYPQPWSSVQAGSTNPRIYTSGTSRNNSQVSLYHQQSATPLSIQPCEHVIVGVGRHIDEHYLADSDCFLDKGRTEIHEWLLSVMRPPYITEFALAYRRATDPGP